MTDRVSRNRPIETRLPCPVCLVTMEKAEIGTRSGGLTLDYCTRCGGVWFERGEVQQLASAQPADLWAAIAPRADIPKPPCHKCGSPLDRDADRCGVCGQSNVLSCPYCDVQMRRASINGLILDSCDVCRGVWFDHKELSAVWTLNLAAAARGQSRTSQALAVGGEVLTDALFWSPGLVIDGAVGLAEAGGAAAEVVGHAAASIFDVIVSIISSIFDGN